MGAATVEAGAEQIPGQQEIDGAYDGSVADGADSLGQMSFDVVGGKRPTVSSLRLVGGRVELEGDFKKGERLKLYVECEVREVAFRDETDKATGQVVGCERRHKAAITGVERVD